ncbi:Fcf2 pre-rRNA processing-domain-containing protein [Tricladium varicosporioides]|nr:Fcf2 pre-rRNA processing-domain-containing protein [Hymenoscyphus varicosporioides]
MTNEDYTDEQLRQLLRDAEQRLRASKNKKNDQDTSMLALQKGIPKVASGDTIPGYITKTKNGALVDSSLLVKPEERKLANCIRKVEYPVMMRAKAAKAKQATAGSKWYDLPRTNLTPELKRDLQLLRMRSVLDPKRHYKKEGSKAQIPEFSQVGTIIEGPTEFFTGRLSNKERKRTLVEEVMRGEKSSGRFKSKYNEIQAAKTSGKKAHYKKMRAQRRGETV